MGVVLFDLAVLDESVLKLLAIDFAELAQKHPEAEAVFYALSNPIDAEMGRRQQERGHVPLPVEHFTPEALALGLKVLGRLTAAAARAERHDAAEFLRRCSELFALERERRGIPPADVVPLPPSN